MKIEIYKTPDIYLAAYLKISGIHYIGTHKNRSKTYLQFQDSDLVRELVHRYSDNTARISPKAIKDTIRGLKTIVTYEKNGPEPI